MPDDGDAWEQAVAAVWASAGHRPASQFAAELRLVAAERPGHPAALYELASVHDFVGEEPEAATLYRSALAAGLDAHRRPRAVIQLASTLRNLGEPAAAAELLQQELRQNPDDGLDDARTAFLALSLFDAHQPAAAVAALLGALLPHVGAYNRALQSYAGELLRQPGQ